MASATPNAVTSGASARGPPQLPGAANWSYNVASTWEHSAALSEEQQRVLELLAEHCTQRPLPEHLGEDEAGGMDGVAPAAVSSAPPGGGEDGEDMQGSLEDAVLQSSTQFYRWNSELEAARTSETEEKYRQYAATLQGHLQTCAGLLQKVHDTMSLLELLKTQHREVVGKTRALHDSCEKLVAEEERLAEFAAALRSKLSYFDELEKTAAHFHSANLAVDSETFMPLLQRLDECITYVTSNPQYADSSSYAGKFRQLQSRALATIRSRVQQVLRHAAEQVQAGIKEWKSNNSSGSLHGSASGGPPLPNGAASNGVSGPLLAEGSEAALLYVRFRAAAEPSLKGLLAGVGARAQRPEYAQLLTDCQRVYCETRLSLVSTVVAERVAEYTRDALPSLTRNGCSYLMQVCQMESSLFDALFPGDNGESGALQPLVEPLALQLYDTLRPAFIQLQDLDALCDLVTILKHEVLEEGLARRGEAVAALRPIILRTLADVQERLTFRTQAFIKEEVVGFVPTPTDLDYPGKLIALEAELRPGEEDDGLLDGADGVDGPLGTADATQESVAVAYKVWYPPVQQTLLCLSKLYRCLDQRVFAGLAQDAVSSCGAIVQMGSRLVAKRSSVMDGQLFLIKQLLILREQIAPFEADFSHVEKDLDFSHMRDHVRRIMAGHASIFSMSSDNAMLQLVSRGAPRVLESQVDSKKELEKLLKSTCEAFIMSVTKLTVEPMLSFITKVTAVKVASSLSSGKPLREQAFAAPPRLEEMVARVRTALEEALPGAVAKMKLYLNNPATHAILFKPIKSNIVEAHGQIASLLETEYTPEEAAAIHLTGPEELKAILDALS